uniref:metal ABC transporter substrate-binding protein n=1 Tax=Pararhizobium sp. IMCC3301 TaxID=3067904 RepID=UPI0027413FFD|nr:metal ABC transporter substrate-binding protein [Pararhizobium sp. IMCC3301]
MRTVILVAAAWVIIGSGVAASAAEKFKVVTTFTVISDMAQQVAGDAALVQSVTKPGAEIHNYQPTPRDILKAQDADLVLWNGFGLELWFERFFRNLRGVPSAVVSDGVEPIGIGSGPYEGKPNPHAWMSPVSALIYVENIRAALATHDPENAAVYNANAARYSATLDETLAPLRAQLAGIAPEKRWLVTSEGAFSYLARDLGFKELFLWPINADAQGSPQQVRAVIDKVRAENIPVVFSESTVSDKPARQVAAETGARYGGVLYVDSLSEADGPVPTFLDMLRVTVETVAKGFSDE